MIGPHVLRCLLPGAAGIAYAAALRLAALWRPDQTALSAPRCLLFSALRTQLGHRAMSEKCYNRTRTADASVFVFEASHQVHGPRADQTGRIKRLPLSTHKLSCETQPVYTKCQEQMFAVSKTVQ